MSVETLKKFYDSVGNKYQLVDDSKVKKAPKKRNTNVSNIDYRTLSRTLSTSVEGIEEINNKLKKKSYQDAKKITKKMDKEKKEARLKELQENPVLYANHHLTELARDINNVKINEHKKELISKGELVLEDSNPLIHLIKNADKKRQVTEAKFEELMEFISKLTEEQQQELWGEDKQLRNKGVTKVDDLMTKKAWEEKLKKSVQNDQNKTEFEAVENKESENVEETEPEQQTQPPIETEVEGPPPTENETTQQQ